MYESLKRDNKKENNKLKKMWNNDKELKVNLWNVVMYLNLSFLVNNVYKSWVALVSSVFPNAVNYFIIKNFPRRLIYFSWNNIWEWRSLN